MSISKVEREIHGKVLSFETGKFAGQANSSVVVRCGETMVLVTAVMSDKPREGIDFLPLTCDFEEKLYAAGKIPGGFFKREGRPTQRAILTSRLMDRPIRPLFPEGLTHDVQVVATPLSADPENPVDIFAMLGASCALTISDIPFMGPVASVRVGKCEGEFVLNPTYSQVETSSLDLIVSGTGDSILMVEAQAKEVLEGDIVNALSFAQAYLRQLVELQEELRSLCGLKKQEPALFKASDKIVQSVDSVRDRLSSVMFEKTPKKEKETRTKLIEKETIEKILQEFEEGEKKQKETEIKQAFYRLQKKIFRERVLKEKVRPDGRVPTDVRSISCEVGVSPRAHGSGLFTRGETQVLATATLGTVHDMQVIDGLVEEEPKRFMHQYNFPPFSVGETRPLRSPGRREIGHGALAEKALENMIPDEETFPYTVRLVSEVLSSNGSTSMASVCGSTLALMDGGVPMKTPVAGVAMGLVLGENSIVVLTDISGAEDAWGDMDFKVAGSGTGVTALQMDIKVKGITVEIVEQAISQAREGRLFILKKILETMPEPRKQLSVYAPRILSMKIPSEKIGEVIGPGGKVIRKLQERFSVKIEVDGDKGLVFVSSTNGEDAENALAVVQRIAYDVEVKPGDKFTGKVTRIADFGAFVEIVPGVEGIVPGKEGLVHISELSWERVARVEDVAKLGDEMQVMIKGIDEMGRVKLSRKNLLLGGTGAERAGGPSHRPRPSGFRGHGSGHSRFGPRRKP